MLMIMKWLIPMILAATVLIAGAFAVIPVQKAQTVHTSVNTVLGDITCDGYDGVDDDDLEFNPATNDCVAP